MSLCDLNCCDLKWLQTKFDAINKKITDNQKLQDKINANIFKILKESGTVVEALLKNYYALNEDDYTKTLTSEDDINTLEPGTYKIVKEDMPQNAPKGFAVTPYDGTLIKSNNYMVLYESNGFHFAAGIPIGVNTVWTWYDYAPYAIIKTLLFNYMQIRNYDKFQYDDVHKLSGFAAGVYTVDATVANLPVQEEGLLIIRQGVNKTDNYIVMFLPQNSNNVYKCFKKTNGSWSAWDRIAFLKNIPSLDGYATETWVNQQIQDITGGSVTADWVKANFLAINSNVYIHITQETDITKLQPGTYYCDSNTLTQNTGIPEIVKAKTTFLIVYHCYQYIRFILQDCSTNSFYVINGAATNYYKIASESDIPSLNGYATQEWVQSQNYLTDIPDDYTTDTEVTQAIAAALVGYATQAWVNQQGFLKEIPDEYVTSSELQAQNYTTQTWVTSRGYQTSGQVDTAITEALNGYAKEAWTKSNFYCLTKDLYSTINSNDNLNDYIEPGTYLSINSTTTATLSNKPTGLQYSFKLIVEEIGGATYFNQRIIENITANCYIRSCSGGNFSNWREVVFTSDLNNYATKEWVGQQGYQTVQQVTSLINTATADMLTKEDLDTFNYATENWVLQTALDGYATQTWINTQLNDYLPKQQDMSLTTQGTYYGLQYQWARYGQVIEVFLVGNLTQDISNQLISNFCPGNPMRTLQTVIAGYDDTKHYAEFNNDGLKLMGSYQNELYINCHFTYLTNE